MSNKKEDKGLKHLRKDTGTILLKYDSCNFGCLLWCLCCPCGVYHEYKNTECLPLCCLYANDNCRICLPFAYENKNRDKYSCCLPCFCGKLTKKFVKGCAFCLCMADDNFVCCFPCFCRKTKLVNGEIINNDRICLCVTKETIENPVTKLPAKQSMR